MDRIDILLDGLDRRHHVGAEIGPFYAPIASKVNGWKTIVIDAYDSQTIRAKAEAHDSSEVRNRAKYVESVDVVWQGERLDAIPMLANCAPLDYIIASHVIEHVPDIVRFLQGAEVLLGDSGILALAVPDSRFCFDCLRFPSTSGEALRAYREARARISPETLYEQIVFGVHKAQQGAWRKDAKGSLSLMSPFEHGFKSYANYVNEFQEPNSEYVDCHAWVFTPSSFELLILELRLMGLLNLQISSLSIETLGSEFFVKLKRAEVQIRRIEFEERRLNLILNIRRELALITH